MRALQLALFIIFSACFWGLNSGPADAQAAGSLFSGGASTSEADTEEQARIAEIMKQAAESGVVAVVSLRPESEWSSIGYDERALVSELGMEFISIPMTASTFETAHVDLLDDALANINGPVLIHCRRASRGSGASRR